MKKRIIPESELVLNPDGSIYHLKLKPGNIAENIIIVGDQGRVSEVSKYFSSVEFRIQNREFITHTGIYNGKRISVISTGIGTDNIDIFMNEIDALVNIDLETRTVKSKKTNLKIVRIGTSGALQEDIDVDSFVVSSHGLGFDGLLNFYAQKNKIFSTKISRAFIHHTGWSKHLPCPYVVSGSPQLLGKIGDGMIKGITATAPGFYGPQGRILRITPSMKNIQEKLTSFRFRNFRITNFEMETSALYGLSRLLGHEACTVCAVIANRIQKKYSRDYHRAIDSLIRLTLQRLTT